MIRITLAAAVTLIALAAAPPAQAGGAWSRTAQLNGLELDGRNMQGRNMQGVDSAKGRAPAKGKGYSLPEKDDEVLLRSRKRGR